MHDLDRTQFEVVGTGSELVREATSPLTEIQELEIATELLEAEGGQELEQFLGRLISGAAQAAGRFIRSDTGRALGGILRGAARQALPIVGRAVGEWVRPGSGATGARFASSAGRLMGLELEGLSPEDKEFELARQFVRFAAGASRCAATLSPSNPPTTAAKQAALAAARNYAPGLVPSLRAGSRGPRARSGTWVRRGRSIEIRGV